METIGVGLIGTGYMGKCHALAWNAVKPVFGDGPRPRLVSLGEATAELAKTRADRYRRIGDRKHFIDGLRKAGLA